MTLAPPSRTPLANVAPKGLMVEPAVLTTGMPRLDEAEAARIAQEHFGVIGRPTLLSGGRDRNFRLVTPAGDTFVLKVCNEADDRSHASLQAAALRHIAARAPDLPVPTVHPAVEGSSEVVVVLDACTRHVVRMLTYLSGTPLHRAPPTLKQAAALGGCLATIGLALRDFRHPAADHGLLWDLKGAAALRPLMPHVAAEHRALAIRALDLFEDEVRPRLATLRRQIVHNDLNPHNVLVDPTDHDRITGVLDFGDMVDTHLVNDVAVAAAYQVDGPDGLGRAAAFVSAYHAASPLWPEEVEVLGDLIALRQAMTLAITAWRASRHPDNRSYILRNAPRAAAALALFDTTGRPAILARLRAACDTEVCT